MTETHRESEREILLGIVCERERKRQREKEREKWFYQPLLSLCTLIFDFFIKLGRFLLMTVHYSLVMIVRGITRLTVKDLPCLILIDTNNKINKGLSIKIIVIHNLV